MTLEQGKTVDLDTRVNGGPVIQHDPFDADAYKIGNNASVLYRDEIKALAEAAGLEVRE